MIDLGKHHRNRLILALLGILFFFAFTANGFGDMKEFFVGDFVWFDTNRDGIQDHGELGVPGVQVSAFDCDKHEPIGETTVTDEHGLYWLSLGKYHKAPPDFFLCFVLPDELDCDFTSPKGHEGANDSDVNSDGCTDCIHWEDHWGNECDRWDAGVCCPDTPDCTGIIGDFVWSDDDCDGIQDDGEPGLEGVTVILTNPDGSEVSFVTGSDGRYEFGGLCPGEYMVRVEAPPAGYFATQVGNDTDFFEIDSDDHFGTMVSLTIGNPDDLTIDFGYCLLECQECDGKVTELTLKYSGPTATIKVVQKSNTTVYDATVPSGGSFTFFGMDNNGTLGTEISVFVNNVLHTKIHTSCSRPIGPGLVSGAFEVISGTSLKGGPLCPIEPPDDDCGPCKGKVTRLKLEYTGVQNAEVSVVQKDGTEVFFGGVSPAGSFEFVGDDKGTLGTGISVFVNDVLHIKIHTSCSRPIGPGSVFGDFKVIEGYSLKGGAICPFDTPPGGDCGPCKGKVTQLELVYTGDIAAFITVVQKKDNDVVFDEIVSPGGSFAFSGTDKDGILGTEIKVFVNGSLNTKIHTSCSQPIGPGLVFGDFEVVSGQSKDGGPLCTGGDDDKKGGKKGGKKDRKKRGKKGK